MKTISLDKKKSAEQLREIFVESVKSKADNKKKVGLMLSGGIDSTSILYSLMELDINITPYTFYMEDYVSKDLLSSRKICEEYSLKLIEAEVPKDNILMDFERLFHYGCHKKTQFETRIHYLYLFPKVKEKILLYGLGADTLYGMRKNVIIRGRNNPTEFNNIRGESYEYLVNVDLELDQRIADEWGFTIKDPYMDRNVYDFFIQFDWQYLNKPYQKWIMLNAFSEYYEKDGYRKHLNFQIASGMRDYCATFVEDESVNVNSKKSVVGVYNDLMRKWKQQE